MNKNHIKHENLRKILEEIYSRSGKLTDELINKLVDELRYSSLILAYDNRGRSTSLKIVPLKGNEYGLVFTDMDEFNKVFSPREAQSKPNNIDTYAEMIDSGICDGFIVNAGSEAFLLSKSMIDNVKGSSTNVPDSDDTYSLEELKEIYSNLDNGGLESFIGNPKNVGLYEELLERISESNLLTLMMSHGDLSGDIEDGVISIDDDGPLAYIYIDEIGGRYACVFTSTERMAKVNGAPKYSQLANFANVVQFALNDDLDGILINPEDERIMLERDVLIEYADSINETCNNSKLDSALFYLFPLDD